MGALVTWLLYSIHILIGNVVHLLFWGVALIALMAGLAAFLATFAAVGVTVAATVHAAGRLGKNRSPRAEGALAAVSALAAAAAFRILMLWVSDLFPDAAATMLQNVFGATGRIGHGPFPMTMPYADSTLRMPASWQNPSSITFTPAESTSVSSVRLPTPIIMARSG